MIKIWIKISFKLFYKPNLKYFALNTLNTYDFEIKFKLYA